MPDRQSTSGRHGDQESPTPVKNLTQLSICALIVTHGRAQSLKRCIESLMAATNPEIDLSFQIVVNGPDSKTKEALEALGETDHLQWQSLEEPVSASKARNIALELVKTSEWVLFIHDDAFVEETYLSRLAETLRHFPQASVIGGPNLTPPDSSVFQRATGVALASGFATFLSASRYRKFKSVRSANEESLIICNLFIKRDVLDQQPFHPDLSCGEENLLLHDLGSSGYHMIHDPELTVQHERRPTLRALAKQVFCFGRGRGRNLRIRPESLKLAQILPPICLLYTGFELVMWFLNGRMSETWLWLIAAYGGLSLFSGFKATYLAGETTEVLRWVFVIFPVIHVSYGLGVIRGWIRK